MAVRNPRVGEERRRWRDIVLVEWRWARRSGSERLVVWVRSTVGGRVFGREIRVSMSQAMRSRTQRTDPARALMTSETRLAK
jgi:hypothetical protein